MQFSTKILALPAALAAFCLTVPMPAKNKTAGGERVTRVEAKYVCSINKKFFDRAQIPVTVQGCTYYACCQSCKNELLNDAMSRMDVDPVSGNRVDKASAVIGADRAGNVYYFENLNNLKAFRAPALLADEPSAGHPSHGSR